MSARVFRKFSPAKASVLVFIAVVLATALFMMRMGQGQAAPASPTDQTKVPHYFGPNPNWALSSLTLPDVGVAITGDGSGAAATATVGANGAITGITVTSPGSGYTSAAVSITGGGSNAAANAVVTASGVVTAVTVANSGGGYTKPVVTISGGGATTDATATAYGAVDGISIVSGGSGYTMPTVDFDVPDDPDGVQAKGHVPMIANGDPVDGMDANGTITAVTIDDPGSGYAGAPGVTIHNGTLMDPIAGATEATVTSTVKILSVGLDTFGAGYTSAPSVAISDTAPGTGSGAQATASTDAGAVTGVTITDPGTGYVTKGGIKKFQDALPALCDPAGLAAPACPATGKYIPLGVPEQKTYGGILADQYEIALIQYRTNFSSSLPNTLVRGYVQIDTGSIPGSQKFPLENELRNGTKMPVLIDGVQAYGVTEPQWLGPTIAATKDKPVRVVFRNLLPTGNDGDLFLPVDSTIMGSGMGPMSMMAPDDLGSVMDGVRNPVCTEPNKGTNLACFADNRATLHLHGGISPWISDGTPHQWITPAGQQTDWPQGVSVQAVPDMTGVDTSATDGVETFYYTNQQSARLMFYHDHAWGITRLNVYAGEAAGYIISDKTEEKLVSSGTIPGPADTIPLIVQDRTFVPQDGQLYDGPVDPATNRPTSYGQDPTWDKSRWGSYGDFWYHHVYMPAQNPGDPSGMSAYGRWMYGPWFWPPATGTTTPHMPIDNPYYDANCKLDVPSTWQYDTDPFCEPKQIPGTPNISVGMEQFNDTPIVNGVAYPTITLEPKTYRLRMLNAANDRFFNFQWYVADPNTASTDLNAAGQAIGGTEVAFKAAELAAAQTDPTVFPTPDMTVSLPGPDWIQIGTEGGFLPAPAFVDGQQPTTWITDPTRFDFGNADKHSLLLAPAERADVIVDFSKYAGQTLILYNDAPAAFPARVPSYDYYTGAPDQSPNGAPSILAGYGPNTRTVMQVKISGTPATAAPAFNLRALNSAFNHKSDGSGVFESGQHPIIVGQAPYNRAYGSSFATGGNCSATATLQICDGYVRVNDTAEFGFNTLKAQTAKTTMPLQPKAIHDEMNATTFDEFGRMTANLGVEAQPPSPGLQNVTLYPYVNPSTELIDGTNLPKAAVTYDANGNPVSDLKIAPISNKNDGTQIWRITHNGVDTHPIHFHLYDVQLINRVTWDNIIIPPDANELGWKDTLRVSPLEDTIVALRPVIPEVPFEVPNAIRDLNPMMPDGDKTMFNNVDPQGNPTNNISNGLVNFGWEYVYHCHILSHEEMDMMRPVSLVLPPIKANGLAVADNNGHWDLNFSDNSITETAFVVQRSTDGVTWTDAGTIPAPLDSPNIHESRTFTDPLAYDPAVVYSYRVVAQNTAGYGSGFPTMTAQSVSDPVLTGPAAAAPTGLTATPQAGPALQPARAALAAPVAGPQVVLTFTDNAVDETGFTIQRAVNGGAWATLTTLPANTVADPTAVGMVAYTDAGLTSGSTYDYRVRSDKNAAASAWSNTVTAVIPAVPAKPTGLTATLQAGPQGLLQWTDNATNEDSYVVERAPTGTPTFTAVATLPAGSASWTDTGVVPGTVYDYRVAAANAISGSSAYSNTVTLDVPAVPAAPSALGALLRAGPQVLVTWVDTATTEAGYTLQRSDNGGAFTTLATLPANSTSFVDTGVVPGGSYAYRVQAFNLSGASSWVGPATVALPALPAAPSALAGMVQAGPQIALTWTDNATNETGFALERSVNGGPFSALAALVANATAYIDAAVSPGATYAYQIRAFNLSGFSAWTGSGAIAVPTLPAAPSLARTVVRTSAGPDRVTLNWVSGDPTVSRFTVQRATDPGFTAGLNTFAVAGGTFAYNDAVPHGKTYYYRVQAVNVIGASAWSNTATVTTVPAVPGNFRTNGRSRTSIQVAWTDNSSNETGFRIQRRRVGGTWATVRTTAANATSWNNTGLNPGTTYEFRMRGFNGVGSSPWTATIRVSTLR